jgi:cytoskeletal protein CcmA (bactofilin family)
MNLTCNLYVDGSFEGIINSQKDIYIGKNGYVNGDVFAQKLIIQGFIEGKINAKRVEIKEGGRVKGSIEYSELVMEAKAIFEGSSIIRDTTATPVEKKLISKP